MLRPKDIVDSLGISAPYVSTHRHQNRQGGATAPSPLVEEGR